MGGLDVDRLADEVVRGAAALIEKELAPLRQRIAALEAMQQKAAKPRHRVTTADWQRPAEAEQ